MKDNHALDELGSLTDEELNAVKAWASEKEGAVVVEVGTLFGLTAREMARSNVGGRVVAVDNFSWNPFGLPSNVHEAFTRQILRGSGVEVVNCDSEDWREKFKGKIDMVFFDASHRYEDVKAECEWAKAAGIEIVSGHDYGNPNPLFGVTRAVDEVFGKENVEVVGMCWRVRK
jgi:predicted O-methyltransferase YrrM